MELDLEPFLISLVGSKESLEVNKWIINKIKSFDRSDSLGFVRDYYISLFDLHKLEIFYIPKMWLIEKNPLFDYLEKYKDLYDAEDLKEKLGTVFYKKRIRNEE